MTGHSETSRDLNQSNLLIGKSEAIETLRKQIQKAKNSSNHVVITGETGTGKELVARLLIPESSGNASVPFISVDSSTIQSSTAESLLFGHEKGAFTGADKIRRGIFEEANQGVVYFDEISNMPLEIQSKLLRVVQEKEVVRLGSSKPIQLDFRVICATNRNLEKMVRRGDFKEDLLQRLNVIPIQTPPLRERIEDIPLLIDYFSRKFGQRNWIQFTNDAMLAFRLYPWPGNVRELSNLIAYLTTMMDRLIVDVEDLPTKFLEDYSAPVYLTEADPQDDRSFYEKVAYFERDLLLKEYHIHRGNIAQLANSLKMDRSHLYTKLKEFGIHLPKKAAKTH